MRFPHRVSQVLLAGFFSMGLILGLAGPAAATDGWQRADNVPNSDVNDNPNYKVCIAEPKVTACFQPYGEHFWLRDEQADGVAVAIKWEWFDNSGHRQGVIYNNHGKRAGWTGKNKSFREQGQMIFEACTVRSIANHRLGDCSAPEFSGT